MKKILLSVFLLFPGLVLCQSGAGQRPTFTVYNLGAPPSGGCPGPNFQYINTANGTQYSCPSSSIGWTVVGPSSGGVTLTTTGTSGAATLVSGTLNIPNYTYTLPVATSSTLGGVKPDGTTLTNTSGAIAVAYTSATYFPFQSITTTGSSGAATLSGGVLNIPQYAGGGSMTWPSTPGIAVCTGTPCTAWTTSLTAPAGTIVGNTDTQTLTNKTMTSGTNTFPTFNQSTTGSAASISISGQTALLTVTGLTSTNRIKTVRDAADTILEQAGTYTPTGTWTWTSCSACVWPTFNQNTTGTASNLSGTPALPNGTTATTQSVADNTTKIATDAFVLANAVTNPMTTLGDDTAGGASGAFARIAGPTAAGVYVKTEIPSGGAATAETYNLTGVKPNPQTGTTYTYLSTDATQDRGNYTTFSNASAIAVTLPQAGSTGFGSNWVNRSCDIGAGTATITPTTSTISYTTGSAYTSGATTLALTTGQCATIYSDNTNYFANVQSAGGSGTTTNALTMNNGGSGATSGTTFNGSAAQTISYNTIGAASLASPTFTGTVTYPRIATTTNCAGAGTAANPSVASCSAAPAGFFSCATNASTGTCVVDTSAVTANSVIQIQPDSSLGTALSVTCNTTADSGLTAPRVSARSAGTSFTIALGTFSSNPECYSFIIVN